jgi:hypothetical protein
MMRESLRTMRRMSWGGWEGTFGWLRMWLVGIRLVEGRLAMVCRVLMSIHTPRVTRASPERVTRPPHLDDGVDLVDVLHPHVEVLVEPPLPFGLVIGSRCDEIVMRL